MRASQQKDSNCLTRIKLYRLLLCWSKLINATKLSVRPLSILCSRYLPHHVVALQPLSFDGLIFLELLHSSTSPTPCNALHTSMLTIFLYCCGGVGVVSSWPKNATKLNVGHRHTARINTVYCFSINYERVQNESDHSFHIHFPICEFVFIVLSVYWKKWFTFFPIESAC